VVVSALASVVFINFWGNKIKWRKIDFPSILQLLKEEIPLELASA